MTRPAILCPVGNTCAMTARHFPECGTATHLTPDMAPDQLCSQALKKAIQNEQNNYRNGDRTVRRRASSEFRRGSLQFELAGTLGNVVDRATHYRYANTHLTTAESHSILRYSGSLNAALFRLHWQHLRDQASSLTTEETQELYEGLIHLANRLGEQDTRPVHQIRAKIGYHMLFATRGIPALPASARQSGALFEGERPKSAHDFYLIDAESSRAIPHRLTSSEDRSPYTGPCVPANFPALAMQAMEEVAPGKITDPIQAGNLGFNLLCDYLEGYEQDDAVVNVLQTMGDLALEQAYRTPGPDSA